MKQIKLTETFNTSNIELYDILLNARKFSKIMGGKASNPMKVGGKFSYFDDYVSGVNKELVPGKKIVQDWTCEDLPKGTFTKLTIEINKKTEKTTDLILTQDNVPDEFAEDFTEMWKSIYFEPIKDYLEDLMWK